MLCSKSPFLQRTSAQTGATAHRLYSSVSETGARQALLFSKHGFPANALILLCCASPALGPFPMPLPFSSQVITHILSFLPIADRKEASLVNHTWYFAAQDSLRQVKPTPPCSPHPCGVPTVPVPLSPRVNGYKPVLIGPQLWIPHVAQAAGSGQSPVATSAAGLLGHRPQGRPLVWPLPGTKDPTANCPRPQSCC